MKIVVCLAPHAQDGNAADLEALEAALQLKDASPGSSLTALSLAPPEADDTIVRTALAVGADEVALVWDGFLHDADSLLTARALARAADPMGPDFVLFGERSPGGATGQVPHQFAEVLDLPCLDAALSVCPGDGGVVVEQSAGPGVRRVLRGLPPAVIVVAPTGRLLRYPRTAERLRAAKASIPVVKPAGAGAGAALRVVGTGLPKPRRRAPLAEAMTLPLHERLQFIAAGGVAQKGGRVVPADPPERAAEEILAFLRSRGIIPGEG